MINYFQSLPKEFYTSSNTASSLDIVTNITSLVTINQDLKDNAVTFYDYVVEDGETPENVAHRFYGNSNRHWIVLMMNNVVHPQFDWPLNTNSLELYINKKYETQANNQTTGVQWAKNNIKSYYKLERRYNIRSNEAREQYLEIDAAAYANTAYTSNEITLDSGETIKIESNGVYVTYYDYEVAMNERKRKIKILKPEYVEMVENELQDKFSV